MRDTKSLLLVILSLLLIVVSLALLWTWGYNYGREKARLPIANHDTFSAGLLSEDSLNELYDQAVSNLSNLDSALTKADSMKLDISSKLTEFYKLRDEIIEMQKKADMSSEKNISELQAKVNELSNQNLIIIKENQRLTELLKELTKKNQSGEASGTLNQSNDNQQVKTKVTKPKSTKIKNIPIQTEADSNAKNNIIAIKDSGSGKSVDKKTKPVVLTTKPSKNVSNTTPVPDANNSDINTTASKTGNKGPKSKDNGKSSTTFFSLSDMNISGLYLDDNKYVETDLASQTAKLSGSFVLKNNRSDIKRGDIHIVVLKPDGKLLQSSTWDAGTFETSNGRRIYSAKVGYNCDIGESRKINFSISADQYPKGNYSFDFYQNGYIIGKTAKTLQ